MTNVTLNDARSVVQFLNGYRGPLELEPLLDAAVLATSLSREAIVTVMDFVNEMKYTQAPPPMIKPTGAAIVIDTSKPLDLMTELTFNYQIAKGLLQKELEKQNMADPEELRKSLREISRFMESGLKMQERLYNVQQLSNFQENVLSIIDDLAPEVKGKIVEALLEAPL